MGVVVGVLECFRGYGLWWFKDGGEVVGVGVGVGEVEVCVGELFCEVVLAGPVFDVCFAGELDAGVCGGWCWHVASVS